MTGRPRDEMLHRVLGLGANLTYILLNESIKLDLIRVGMASAYLWQIHNLFFCEVTYYVSSIGKNYEMMWKYRSLLNM